MAQYTIEDIEILRQKSGISYEEAVNLLEYHNGSLARALVDLEKNGRIRESRGGAYGARGKRSHNLFTSLYRTRVKMSKGETTIINLSALFMIFAVMVAPWLVVIGIVLALALGYRIAMERNSNAFSGDTLESMVRNAGANVRNTVYTFTRDFNAKTQNQHADTAAGQPEKPAEPEIRSESPASGTTPVNVQFSEEGNIRVSENRDGFHEADIE